MTALDQLMNSERPANTVVCYDDWEALSWNRFRKDVIGAIGEFREVGQRCVLGTTDAYAFAVGFFAGLHAGKTLVLPANLQPGSINEAAAGADWVVDTADLADSGMAGAMPASARLPVIDRDAPLIELYTSGSSGDRKSIIKTLAQLDAEVAVLETIWGDECEGATVLAAVSHQHIYGLLFRLLWPLAAGRPFGRRVLAYPEEAVADAQQAGRAVLVASPAQLQRMPDLIDPRELLEFCPLIFSSGGPLSAEAAYAFEAAGRAPVEVFGSTETGGIAWRRQRPDAQVPWDPLPGVELQQQPESGLLQVRSPYVSVEGGAGSWFTMGDAVKFEDDGRFMLCGRRDRIAKVGEKRVSLADIEKRLVASEWVKDCCAVTLEQGRRTVIAVVATLTPQGEASLEDQGRRQMAQTLRAYLAAHFDAVCLPRKWRYLDELPMNSQGKRPVDMVRAVFDDSGFGRRDT
jgi:acyl-coenzyme A synthetase/AMP-(fatty) acid ligase